MPISDKNVYIIKKKLLLSLAGAMKPFLEEKKSLITAVLLMIGNIIIISINHQIVFVFNTEKYNNPLPKKIFKNLSNKPIWQFNGYS